MAFVPVFGIVALLSVAVVGLAKAFERRLTVLVLVAILLAVFASPMVHWTLRLLHFDIDHELQVADQRIWVKARGPLPLTVQKPLTPYGQASFATLVQGVGEPAAVEFRLSPPLTPVPQFDLRSCQAVPGPFGLMKVVFDTARPKDHLCNKGFGRQPVQVFFWANAPDPTAQIICALHRDTFCTVAFRSNDYRVVISLWQVPLEHWRAAVDQVTAVISQSFRSVGSVAQSLRSAP